jgi:hypothetical protein
MLISQVTRLFLYYIDQKTSQVYMDVCVTNIQRVEIISVLFYRILYDPYRNPTKWIPRVRFHRKP